MYGLIYMPQKGFCMCARMCLCACLSRSIGSSINTMNNFLWGVYLEETFSHFFFFFYYGKLIQNTRIEIIEALTINLKFVARMRTHSTILELQTHHLHPQGRVNCVCFLSFQFWAENRGHCSMSKASAISVESPKMFDGEGATPRK